MSQQNSSDNFSSLNLQPELLKNLESLGYKEMTPIQAQSLPVTLAGQDIIAQAKTGSGKTAAFGLSVLHNLNVKKFRVQALVLCPTRELADQVAKELRRLARSIHNIKILTLCGGMSFGPQVGSLEHGAHIVVGTPGRIEEHLRKNNLNLDNLNTLVFDEADRMLDMGFQQSIDDIVSYAPKQRQTLLFSATYPAEISKISQRYLNNPADIRVESSHSHETISQHFYEVANNEERLTAIRLLLLDRNPKSTVIFCNTKRETQEIADGLRDFGFAALALNGDLEQKQRDQILVRFSNKSAAVLVATDVAARGLDIDSLDAVINYQASRELEVHTHRIGRTGRAGNKGFAGTLFTTKEKYKIGLLEDYLNISITPEALPNIDTLEQIPYQPEMVTFQIDGGKKQKVRPGDILGALTGANGIPGDHVGKINVFDFSAYVAVNKKSARIALQKLTDGKLKGRSFRSRQIRG
jgi:ATP-independent RNA helicase DbpA